jgi:hypothetical protein
MVSVSIVEINLTIGKSLGSNVSKPNDLRFKGIDVVEAIVQFDGRKRGCRREFGISIPLE